MAIDSTAPLAAPAPLGAPPLEPRSARRRGLLSEINKHRTDYLWIAPALLVMVLVIGYPFLYTIDLSFYDGGQAYTEGEYRTWLTAAGFVDITRDEEVSGSGILRARKAG